MLHLHSKREEFFLPQLFGEGVEQCSWGSGSFCTHPLPVALHSPTSWSCLHSLTPVVLSLSRDTRQKKSVGSWAQDHWGLLQWISWKGRIIVLQAFCVVVNPSKAGIQAFFFFVKTFIEYLFLHEKFFNILVTENRKDPENVSWGLIYGVIKLTISFLSLSLSPERS